MTNDAVRNPTRHLRRAIIALATISALFLAIWVALQLDPLRRFIVDSGLSAAESDNLKLTYEDVGGNWPWSIRLKNLAVQDQEGTWLTIAETQLVWSPLAMARGHFSASQLRVDQVHLVRRPISENTEPSDPHIFPELPSLPISIDLQRFEVTNIVLDQALMGTPVEATIDGFLDWQGETLRFVMNAVEEGDQNLRAKLKSKIDSRNDVFEMDLDVRDSGTGLLNRILDLGTNENITLSASGNGPDTDWRGQFAIETSTQGKVSGSLKINQVRPLTVEADIRVQPGPQSSSEIVALVGKQATIRLSSRDVTFDDLTVDALTLDTESSMSLQASGTVDLKTETTEGNASVSISDLSVLSQLTNSDMSGELRLDATASGTFESLGVSTTIAGEKVRIDDTPFGTITGEVLWPGASARQGAINVTIDSPLGPGTISSSILRSSENDVRLSQLSGNWLSSQIDGDITLHQNGALSGALAFDIASLEQVSFLSQFAGLSAIGGSARGTIDLPRPEQEGLQKVDAVLANFSFGSGTDMIAAETVTLRAVIGTDADQSIDATLKSNNVLLPGLVATTSIERLEASTDGRVGNAQWRLLAEQINQSSDRLSVAGAIQSSDTGVTSIVVSNLVGQIADQAITLTTPVTFAQSDNGWDLSALEIRYGEGSITGTAKAAGEGLLADVDLSNVPLRIASDAFEPISSSLTANVKLDTIGRKKSGSAEFSLLSTSGDNPLASTRGTAEWDGQELRLSGDMENIGRFDGSLPLRVINGSFGFAPNGPVGFSAKLAGNIGPLWQLGPFSEYDLGGDASLDMTASGTWASPVISGEGQLVNGRFESLADGILFEDLSVGLTAENSEHATLNMTASDGDGGRISGKGFIKFETENKFPISITADFDKAKILRSENYDAQISGQVSLAGQTDALVLNGDVLINRMDVRIPNDLPPSVVDIPVELVNVPPALRDQTETGQRTAENPISLDLSLRAPNRIFVEGRGLDTEWKAKAKIFGNTNTPRIDGNAEIVKGTFEFAGRPFDLEQGQIVFDGGKTIDPRLNILASREDDDITVSVRVQGPASDPSFSFQSNPSLPQEDVLARVLFGKPLADLSYVELAQLGESVASLSGKGLGGGGRGFFGNVRQSLGVDVLSFDTGSIAGAAADDEDAVGPSLTVGKYVSDRVYVGVTQGTDEDSTAVEVEVDITRRLSLSTEVGQKANSNIGLNWSWDY